jgi:hypothetical protein
MLAGLNVALAPDGTPLADRFTVWALPEVTAVLMVVLTDPPAVTLTLDGEALMEKSLDAGGFTVRVTGTLTGELVAPVAEMVMVPLYVPAARPEVFAETVTDEGAVPLAGLMVSQVALEEPDQVSVPPPVLLTLSVWLAGLAPPWVPVKEKLAGLTPMVGATVPWVPL